MKDERVFGYALRKMEAAHPIGVTLSGYSLWSPQREFVRVGQPIFSIEMVVRGQVTLECERGRFVIEKGELFVLNTPTHRYYNSGDTKMLKRFVNISGSSADSICKTIGLDNISHIKPKNPQLFLSILRDINHCLMGMPEGFKEEASSLGYKLLLMLKDEIVPEVPYCLRKVIGYIERNLDQELSARILSKVAGVSEGYFNRLFRKYHEVSPNQYVIEKRIAFGKTLLLTSHQSIQEVAFQCGYKDPLYFSKQFKKIESLSPRQFRNSV